MMPHTSPPPRDKKPEPETCPRCGKPADDHDWFDRPGGQPLKKPECRKGDK